MPTSKFIEIPQIRGPVEYVIGKNAQDNFDIIDDAEEYQMWFHIEGAPSGHVIAKIDDNLDKKQMRYIIKQGAVICKQVSKFASAKDVNIVYARVGDVEKTDTLGKVNVKKSKTVSI